MQIFASDVGWRLDSRRYMCPPYGVQANLGTYVSPRGADSGTERGHRGATRRVRISPACSQTLDADMARVSFTGQLDNGECETPTLGSLCPLREGNVSRSLALLGVLILAACLCVCTRSKGLIYAALPALVLVVLWTVCLSFAESGLYGLVGASPTLVYLAYSSLSSFQLSELKEVYGMSEARICSLDKFMYGLGLSSAGAIHSPSWLIDPLMNGRSPFSSVLFAVAVFLFSVASGRRPCWSVLAKRERFGVSLDRRAKNPSRWHAVWWRRSSVFRQESGRPSTISAMDMLAATSPTSLACKMERQRPTYPVCTKSSTSIQRMNSPAS